MRHVMTAIVENKPGVLASIVGLFSGRGYNIDSLSVNSTEDPAQSRVTVFVEGDDGILEQVRKQLSKLIDVIKVQDFSREKYVQRETMLVKVHALPAKRTEIFHLTEMFGGKIVDISEDSLVIEVTGPEEKVVAFVEVARPYGIKEVARSGCIAMARTVKRSGTA
ncbi:MAG: acetolactate synthase small subunit [Planctomycetota bacterium]